MSLTKEQIVDDIMRRDTDPPMYKKPYRRWLQSLTAAELDEYYGLVKQEHPDPQPASV